MCCVCALCFFSISFSFFGKTLRIRTYTQSLLLLLCVATHPSVLDPLLLSSRQTLMSAAAAPSLEGKAKDWMTSNLTADDCKLLIPLFTTQGVLTLTDVERLSREDLSELKVPIGMRVFGSTHKIIALFSLGLHLLTLCAVLWFDHRSTQPVFGCYRKAQNQNTPNTRSSSACQTQRIDS